MIIHRSLRPTIALLTTLIVTMHLVAPLAQAQTASSSPKATTSPRPTASPKTSPNPSAIATSTDSATTTQKLRERIERIVEEKRDQVKGALADLSQRRRGFIGEVQRISDEAITIKNGSTTNIFPLTDSLLLLRNKQKQKLDDVAVGDWALVIGQTVDDTFQVETIFLSATSLRPPSPVITLGTIEKIERSTFTVQPRSGEGVRMYSLGKNTTIEDNENNTLQTKDLTTDLQVVVIGRPDPKNPNSPPIATSIRLLAPLSNASGN